MLSGVVVDTCVYMYMHAGGAVVGGVIAVPIIVVLVVPVATVAISAYLSYSLVRKVKRAVRYHR